MVDVLEFFLRVGVNFVVCMYGGCILLGSVMFWFSFIFVCFFCVYGVFEFEGEDDKFGFCSSSSDSDSGDEGVS